MRRFALLIAAVTSVAACSAATDLQPTPLRGDRPEATVTPPTIRPVSCPTSVEVFALVDGISVDDEDSIEAGSAITFVSATEGTDPLWTIRDVTEDRVLARLLEAEPQFEPPAPGRYAVRLELTAGDCSLQSAPFEFWIVTADPPSPGVTIELSWHTPGDVDADDLESANLDLHYRHQRGFWNSDPWDCWTENKGPDWGPAGLPGNPHLLASAFGFRPEILEHAAPEQAFYEFGVHYADDAGFGRSVAIVSVFFNGALMHKDAATLVPGAFWPVGVVEGSTGTVFPHQPSGSTSVRP